MLSSFDLHRQADEMVEPYVPTAQDLIEMHADYEEMKRLDGHCCECGTPLNDGVCPECDEFLDLDEEPYDDFPMMYEYEGAFGLSGYDEY